MGEQLTTELSALGAEAITRSSTPCWTRPALQLPPEMIEPLGMRDRVRLEAEPDHIGVWPDVPRAPDDDAEEGPAPA